MSVSAGAIRQARLTTLAASQRGLVTQENEDSKRGGYRSRRDRRVEGPTTCTGSSTDSFFILTVYTYMYWSSRGELISVASVELTVTRMPSVTVSLCVSHAIAWSQGLTEIACHVMGMGFY